MITVLLPSSSQDHKEAVRRLVSMDTLAPFDPLVVEFLNAVSRTVLLDPTMRRVPEMMAVAYWMRRAHLHELREAFDKQRGDRIWLPRGVALHFTPANVDSIFLYSWFLSMLAGNANILRLSARRSAEVDFLLTTINRLCAEDRFQAIANRSLILSYDHDDAFSRELSEACQVRVLWGGDESVRRLRAVPLNPLAIEVAFANRFSLSVLNAESVAHASQETITDVAARFYRDAYWFDQKACSSPRLVVWVGPAERRQTAQRMFWSALADEVKKRGVEYADMIGLNKLVSAYVSAATGVADEIQPGITGAIGRIHLVRGTEGRFRDVECGGGLFFETEVSHLDEVGPMLTERDQTLSYFGFEREQLIALARALSGRAIDRIVPVGTALEFSSVWDGSNLLQVFSRELEVR